MKESHKALERINDIADRVPFDLDAVSRIIADHDGHYTPEGDRYEFLDGSILDGFLETAYDDLADLEATAFDLHGA